MAKLDASVEALVTSGRERYEDAITCDAIRQFIIQAGDIPADAWGEMPWTGRWRADWATARDARVTEATTIRDRLGETGAALVQVASDYAHTDINVALNFDISEQNAALQPYLDAVRKSNGLTVHAGGHAGGPQYYDGGQVKVTPPGGNTADAIKLQWMQYDHALNQAEITSPGTVTPTMKARQHFDSPGRSELWKFVNEHYETLTKAENIVNGNGEGLSKNPSTDFIDPAIHAWPQVIMDRADLMHVAARMYTEMKQEMGPETQYLMSYWDSPAGSGAYNLYATNLENYLDTCAQQCTWLGDEGVKAGKGIDKLMLAYAQAGYEKIGIIIEQLQAYEDAMESISGSVDDPLKALTAALGAMADIMLSAWKAQNDEAQSTLNLAATVQDNAPDLGSSAHSAQPFPESAGLDGWKRGNNWQPATVGAS